MAPLYLTTVVALLVTSTVLGSGVPVYEDKANTLDTLISLLELNENQKQAQMADKDKEEPELQLYKEQENLLAQMILKMLTSKEIEIENMDQQQLSDMKETDKITKKIDQDVQQQAQMADLDQEDAQMVVLDQEDADNQIYEDQNNSLTQIILEMLTNKEIEIESWDQQLSSDKKETDKITQKIDQDTQQQAQHEEEMNSIQSTYEKLLQLNEKEQEIVEALEEKISQLQTIQTSLKSLEAEAQQVQLGGKGK